MRVRTLKHGKPIKQDPPTRWDNERMPWPEEYLDLEPYNKVRGVEFTIITPATRLSEGDR
jgi:hypothetical protein